MKNKSFLIIILFLNNFALKGNIVESCLLQKSDTKSGVLQKVALYGENHNEMNKNYEQNEKIEEILLANSSLLLLVETDYRKHENVKNLSPTKYLSEKVEQQNVIDIETRKYIRYLNMRNQILKIVYEKFMPGYTTSDFWNGKAKLDIKGIKNCNEIEQLQASSFKEIFDQIKNTVNKLIQEFEDLYKSMPKNEKIILQKYLEKTKSQIFKKIKNIRNQLKQSIFSINPSILKNPINQVMVEILEEYNKNPKKVIRTLRTIESVNYELANKFNSMLNMKLILEVLKNQNNYASFVGFNHIDEIKKIFEELDFETLEHNIKYRKVGGREIKDVYTPIDTKDFSFIVN